MAVLEKVSTLEDMKALMIELHRLKIKLLYDFYAVLQDFSSKKLLPQWLQKKNVNDIIIKDSGNEVLAKIIASKRHSIIVYDLETPDLNGLEFLANLEKTPDIKSKCKVILSTPRLPMDAQDKLMLLGAKALISKPLVENELRVAFGKVGLDY
jgi:CheY-like chemotaxis protein